MRQSNKTMTTLVLTALLSAITLLCTLLLKVPVGPDCYIHLGDAIVFLGVIILPRKYACFAGPVGATLADLLGGFAFWAPWTFFIKLLVAILFGFFIDRVMKDDNVHKVVGVPVAEWIGYLLASVIGVFGYFMAEYIMFGNWVAAAVCIPLNCLQMGVGAVVAVLVSNALAKSNMRDSMLYIR